MKMYRVVDLSSNTVIYRGTNDECIQFMRNNPNPHLAMCLDM